MFAIGTAEETVSGMKLRIPKEYNLNKKEGKFTVCGWEKIPCIYRMRWIRCGPEPEEMEIFLM